MEHLSIFDLQDAASKTLDKDQFLKNEEDVAMPRILCALGAATSPELAPELTITSRKRKEIPFFDTAREGQLDDTKSLRGLLIKRDILATYYYYYYYYIPDCKS